MKPLYIKTPWLSSYGDLPHQLDYCEKSICEAVLDTVKRESDFTALSFQGRQISYDKLAQNIDLVARSFYHLGVRPGNRVLVCMPNIPQSVYCLYALNRIGAIATMVHPLSAIGEIVHYLNETSCEYAIALDQFYKKFTDVLSQYQLKKLIITSISDELPLFKSIGYKLFVERKFPKVTTNNSVMLWGQFLNGAESVKEGYIAEKNPNSEAVVLFSGGTTGTSKGIMLSDMNFNALALQTATMSHEEVRHAKMLAAMPVFHGFGLGVCIHTMMVAGGTSILVPRFNVKSYAKLIKQNKPNFIAGVPTLFEAIARSKFLDGVDLSCLRGVFSGGDSLPIELKKKFDTFLAEHNATVRIREGYGTTECVAASCLTPYNKEKEGSIGIPYPDTYYKICSIGTNDEVPYGTYGEICIAGPSVMLGYINHEEENKQTLRRHDDGYIWLHTGDMGMMDDEGFVYFRQRIKRMIITSGYNVYPSQIEKVLNAMNCIQTSCVVGVPDPLKIQKVKAFVVLADGYKDSPELRKQIDEHCHKHIAKYALPYEIEVRDSLPTTLIGKVAYTQLS